MNLALLSSLIFAVTVIAFVISLFGLLTRGKAAKAELIRTRLRAATGPGVQLEELEIVRNQSFSDLPWVNRTLKRLSSFQGVKTLIEQSGVSVNVGTVLLSSLLLFAIGFSLVMGPYSVGPAIAVAFLFAFLPYLWLKRRRANRMRQFESQLPEALDTIARALRAGHAFANSLTLIAREFDPPLGEEFKKTVDEINLGISVNRALENLNRRVKSTDLSFFVTAVTIQRESGGNLAEILTTIAMLIRERFAFRRHVRSLTAQGRLSAYILLALPFLVGTAIFFLNPGYLNELFDHPMGHSIITLQLVFMVGGALIIRRMVKLEV
jgi:tight adherence protein B